MGSYEEWVVDREVETAWLQFKVRLADHLSSMGEGEALALCVRGADDTIAVGLHLRTVGRSGFAAEWDWVDETDRRGARHERPTRFSSQQLDSYVRRIHDVLRADGVQHPAFIEVHESDLVLVDPPKDVVSRPTKPETPESIVPSSPEDLKMWVDRVLAQRLGREPKENKDGSVSLFRNGSFVTIRLSSSRPLEQQPADHRGLVDRGSRRRCPQGPQACRSDECSVPLLRLCAGGQQDLRRKHGQRSFVLPRAPEPCDRRNLWIPGF